MRVVWVVVSLVRVVWVVVSLVRDVRGCPRRWRGGSPAAAQRSGASGGPGTWEVAAVRPLGGFADT